MESAGPQKHRFLFTKPYDVTFQKKIMFNTTTVCAVLEGLRQQ